MLRLGPAPIWLAVAALLFSGADAESQERVAPDGVPATEFAALGSDILLAGYLFRPTASDAPRPAVVMMHGCSGLFNPSGGQYFPLYPPWVRALTDAGYVVFVVDSATPRGFGQTCSGPSPMGRERPRDAYAALAYLQAQPFVRADRIALMGWSQGGGAVLTALNERSIGKLSPAGLQIMARFPHDFRAAVAFYPGACSRFAQSLASLPDEPDGWTSRVPLLVLFGDADVWTPLAPCQTFLDAAKARGNPIELKVYPGAVHAFDAPNMKRTELPQYRTREGQVPVLETDPAARADVFPRVLRFLKAAMQP